MSADLRARMVAIIRQDLAAEADAGFPLVTRFPNSEIAGVPGCFARLSAPDRNALLDALAQYSTLQWSHDIVRERRAHPVLGPWLAKRPLYPEGDWYGARPRKSLLKRSVVGKLTDAGFVRLKRDAPPQPDIFEFSRADAPGRLIVSFDPGLMRQMDFGIRNWLRPELAKHFELPGPRDFIPIVGWLAYDHLWHGAGTNNPVCWDVIAEKDLGETGALVVEVVGRLSALAARVNALPLD